MHPNAEGEDQEAELAQAMDDSIDVAIVAEANIAKGNKSIECVSARCVLLMILGQTLAPANAFKMLILCFRRQCTRHAHSHRW